MTKYARDIPASNPVEDVVLHKPVSRRAFVSAPLALRLGRAALAGLAVSPVTAGLGMAMCQTEALAATYDAWVQVSYSVSANGYSTQTCHYWVNSAVNSDGSVNVYVKTALTHNAYTYSYWTTTKTLYDNGTQCAYIGADYSSRAYHGQTITQQASFTSKGGGSHHITSTETVFRGSAGTYASWDFYIEIPYTGKITIDVRAVCDKDTDRGQAAHVIPDGDYVIRYRDNPAYCLSLGYTNNAAAIRCGDKTPQLKKYDGSSTEMYWHLDYTSESDDSTFHVRPMGNLMLALETPNAVSSSTRAGLWHVNGNAHHYWRLAKASDGSYELLAGHNSSMALDLAGASVSQGNAVNSHPRNNSAAQRWVLDPVRVSGGGSVDSWPADAKVGPSGIVYALEDSNLNEVARVTMSGRQATFDKYVSSLGQYYVRMVSAPAGVRLDTRRRGVRLCQDGDTAFLTYEILPSYVVVLTVDEDDRWVVVSNNEKAGFCGETPTLSSLRDGETCWWLGETPAQWKGRETEWYYACNGIYDRDPLDAARVALGTAYPGKLTKALTETMTLVTRLPDTVTFKSVCGGRVGEVTCALPMKRQLEPVLLFHYAFYGDHASTPSSATSTEEKHYVSEFRARSVGASYYRLFVEMNATFGAENWDAVAYSDEACESVATCLDTPALWKIGEPTRLSWKIDKDAKTWNSSAHATLYLKVNAHAVRYVVDGVLMATDYVLPTDSWEVPAERTTKATRPGCTPGFSGWHLDPEDEGVAANEAGKGGSSKVAGPIAVQEDLTLYGTNRATVSFGIDERSTADVTADGVLVEPQTWAEPATAADTGLLDPIVRRVNRTATLPSLSPLYALNAAGRYVTYKPDAWYAFPVGDIELPETSSSGLRVSHDTKCTVIWTKSTNDGTSARR